MIFLTRAINAARQRSADTSSDWLYWLLPIAAAAALIIYFAVRPTQEVAQQGMNQAQNVAAQGVDIGKQIGCVPTIRLFMDERGHEPRSLALKGTNQITISGLYEIV